MRLKLYNFLTNRHSGIAYRYHAFHDGTAGFLKILSWGYLLWLNFAYYILCCRFLGEKPEAEFYESKRLPVKESESEEYHRKNKGLSVEAYVERLKKYDVVSFDIFDTLILRPVDQPTDIFYLLGEQLGIMDFRNIRMRAEAEAREHCRKERGHTEVTLEEIWKKLSAEVGCSGEKGMETEIKTEQALCYANPFMLAVWRELAALGKERILVSDMYLPGQVIADILEKAGFTGAAKYYISCEHKKSKADGGLFDLVKSDCPGKSVIHVGDNPHSDGKMAEKRGLAVCLYPNVNHNVRLYRACDMSYLIGSAYRGIVSGHLYNGREIYGMEYEYGFIYGGLFVLGYCGFIHDFCREKQTDKILFLSRDGDILKQAYDRLYPGENTAYAYWSRKAAVKLMAGEDRHDYFRRFLWHKVNQGYTAEDIFCAMELEFLPDEWKGDRAELLTDKNANRFRRFVEDRWDTVEGAYRSQQRAAGTYYREMLAGCARAAAVDIGWAGSGALALSHLTRHVWNIPCEITGIIAGTNTPHNAEPDAAEPFLQSGRLTAYLYSQGHNRDLLKKHNPNRDYNVFWELLLSSPTPKFTGFYEGKPKGGDMRSRGEYTYCREHDISLAFGAYDANLEGIREIQRGILDFVQEYSARLKDFPCMLRVSGRDAYAPMIVAASRHERYLKALESRFSMEINVD